MSDASVLYTLLSQMVFLLPTLLICIFGIVMVHKRLPAGKARKAGVLGFSLLLMGAFANLLFYVVINRLLSSQDYSGHGNMPMINTLYRFISLLHSGGLIFLIIALCSREPAGAEKIDQQNPYGP